MEPGENELSPEEGIEDGLRLAPAQAAQVR